MVNRLIIIGNGFDLAHGLKTSYSDFIKGYFNSLKKLNFKDAFFECDTVVELDTSLSSIDELENLISQTFKNSYGRRGENKYNILNDLFHKLCKKSVHNWVDIEAEYYSMLLKTINDSNPLHTRDNVRKLNSEMDAIINRFEEYLLNDVLDEIDKSFNKELHKIFKIKSFNNYESITDFSREFPAKYKSKLSTSYHQSLNYPIGSPNFKSTVVLNFNYTQTAEKLYFSDMENVQILNIHGTVSDKNNPLNLGFGDEKNKSYSEIEDLNENEYLRLMKSIAYSNTDNYRKLFDFIEEADFQVQIMGHSCGISDRTLLNAIFENNNCKSIKVFFHEWTDESGTKRNNYSEIVQNISRQFQNKLMMREKIVNKTLCVPLPQNKK